MMMMSLSPVELGSNKPLLTPAKLTNKQAIQGASTTEKGQSASNSAGLSAQDLDLLSQLLASSKETSVSAEPSVSKPIAPSGALLEAQLPNIHRDAICKQDGLCSTCAVE